MNDITYFYPEGHQAHFEQGHPERPERIEAIREALEAAGWWRPFPRVEPEPVPEDVLTAIHTPDYLTRLEASCRAGRRFDADTYVTRASWDLALRAAGGAIAVAGAVWRREAGRGFALTRPPGHHATPDRAMGFCLLNNVALAAEYLLQKERAARVAIVDLDLHHGNGTQDIFWDRGEVVYISTHQSPLYPGTGQIGETGAGDGQGATANFPLPPYSGDRALGTVMDVLILPLLDRFQPQMVLVSAGFDPHWRDPLGSLILTSAGYRDLIRELVAWVDTHCQGRIAVCLEGGYDLDAGAACAQGVVAALLDRPWKDPLGQPPWPESEAWQGMVARARQIWSL